MVGFISRRGSGTDSVSLIRVCKQRSYPLPRHSWTTYAVIWPVLCAMLFGAVVTSGFSNGRATAIPIGLLLSLPAGLFLGGIAIAAGNAALAVIRRGILRDSTVGRILLFTLITAVAVTSVASLPFLMGGSSTVADAVAPLSILFAAAIVGASTYAPLALRGDAPRH